MVTIIFESHRTSLDNEKHLSSGHFDTELSELGIRQSKELGERYAHEHFDAIFCSDLQRSYKTAQIAFGNKFSIIQDARLRECNYGELTQHPSEEVEPAKARYITTPFPGGESYNQTTHRMSQFLKDLSKNYDGKKVMIVGHRATQYGLETWINGVHTYLAVTAPWKWQPGWTYKLYAIDEPFEFMGGTICLPYTQSGLVERFEAFGKNWVVKSEFHVSVINTKQVQEKAPNISTDDILKYVKKFLTTNTLELSRFTGEVRMAQKADRVTLVAMCEINNLDLLYRQIAEDMGIELEMPPAHITLYTLENGLPIGIKTRADLDTKTRALSKKEHEEFLQKSRIHLA